MQTSDQTVYLYKKSLGIANTNVNKVSGLEIYTSPLSANAANIYTQTIPDADLSSALTTDGTWSLGSSTRKYATAFPYIAYYENVSLATMSDNPGIAFRVSGNINLLKGTLPSYKLLVGGIATTPVYTLTVKNSLGTLINPANYMVDADSGIVTFYNEATVSDTLLPTISFWRYEGARLANVLLTSNIGIGTSAPQAPFHIYNSNTGHPALIRIESEVAAYGGGDDGPGIEFYTKNTNNGGSYFQASIQGIDNTVGTQGSGAGGLRFLTYDNTVQSEKMRITSVGNVGIGTSNPQYLLDINGAAGIKGGINNSVGGDLITKRFNPNDKYGIGQYSDGAMRMFASAAYPGASTRLSFANNDTVVETSTGFVDVLTAKRGGNVGIGTTDPQVPLHIYNANIGHPTLIRIESEVAAYGGGDDGPGIEFYTKFRTNGTSYFQASIQGIDNTVGTQGSGAGGLRFNTYDNAVTSEKMRITSVGNVGIGTTDPLFKVDVAGAVRASNIFITNRSGTENTMGNLIIENNSGQPCTRFTANGTDQAVSYIQAVSNFYFTPWANGTPVMTIGTSGTYSGRIGIGTASPGYKLDVNGSSTSPTVGGYNMYNDSVASWYGSDTVSIHASHTIWSERRVIVSSDQRIKKDIVELNDNEALEDLRKIEPKKYKYIDMSQRGNTEVYGFLAQQVSTIVTNATSRQTSFIPDIYSSYTVAVTNNLSTQYVAFETSSDMISSLKVSQRLKFYDATQEFNTTISSIQANRVILEVSDITMPPVSTFSSMVFLYGTEVDDFLTLSKDSLFTLAFAATQQIDRIQQSSLQTVASLTTQLSCAMVRLDAQESTIATLLTRC